MLSNLSEPALRAAGAFASGPLARASASVVVVGWQEPPESPSKGPGCCSFQRRHSLLSDALAGDPIRARRGGSGGPEGAANGSAPRPPACSDDDLDDDYDDDDPEEGALDEDELSLLEGLEAAWSPSSSIRSAGAASRASTASSSRPIAIPAATYFKDQAQRMHLDRLNKKRQWYSQNAEQGRLLGKAGAKAVAQQVPRPPAKVHKQYSRQAGQQK